MKFGYRVVGTEINREIMWGLDNKDNGIWDLKSIVKILDIEIDKIREMVKENNGTFYITEGGRSELILFKEQFDLINFCCLLEPNLIMATIVE